MFKVEVQNVDEVVTFLIELPEKLDKEMTYTNTSFMNLVLEGAKVRAPVDTGGLRDSIKLQPIRRGKNVKKWQLVVGSPHALFQEEGFTPHSFFAGTGFNSAKLPGGRTYYVSKWTPFIKPALAVQLITFDDKLNKAIGRAIEE